MGFAYTAYRILSNGLLGALLPPCWLFASLGGRNPDAFRQRLGLHPRQSVGHPGRSPRIWLHAVSVGEVGVAEALVDALEALLPDSAIILSTTTAHGQAQARTRLGARAECIYAPVDFSAAVRRALTAVQPDVLVCLETEIWPNWLFEAHRRGIRLAMVNGRISVRSIDGYLKVRPLIKETLALVDAFSMVSREDAKRIRMLGAPADRIFVNGNAKFDSLLPEADPAAAREMTALYGLTGDEPVFVAGSTRGTEAETILDAYCRIIAAVPRTVLIIVPRHPHRAARIEQAARSRGLDVQLRSRLGENGRRRTAPVVIVDTIGELQATYAIASVVFCGGSLVPLGGQNVLEAAVWGKPVLYGPSMEDFLDAKHLLEGARGAIPIAGVHDLIDTSIYYLTHRRQALALGGRARTAVMASRGAARRHAALIRRLAGKAADR